MPRAEPEMAFTRAEIVAARNGSGPPDTSRSPAAPPPAVDAAREPGSGLPERLCGRPGCGTPLRSDQKRYCSLGCARSCATPPHRRQEQPEPSPVGDIPSLDLLALLDQLPPQVEALEIAGGWRLSRTTA